MSENIITIDIGDLQKSARSHRATKFDAIFQQLEELEPGKALVYTCADERDVMNNLSGLRTHLRVRYPEFTLMKRKHTLYIFRKEDAMKIGIKRSSRSRDESE